MVDATKVTAKISRITTSGRVSCRRLQRDCQLATARASTDRCDFTPHGGVAQLDPQVVGRQHGKPIGPLDDDDAAAIADDVFDAELDEFRLSLDAVQIDMPHDESAAAILVHKRKCWTVRRTRAERFRQARYERRLASAELTDKRNRVSAMHDRRQLRAERFRRLRVCEDQHASQLAVRRMPIT